MPAKVHTLLLACCLSAALISPVQADDSTAPPARPNLEHLLAVAARNTNKRFIVAHAGRDISWAGVEDKAVNYPILLMILADNGLAAVEDSGVVNIVPLANIRQYPTVTLTARDLDKAHIPDDQVITVLIHLEHIDAEKLVPVIRPLMPQWAQLSGVPETNTLIMAASFANARRLAGIVHGLDQSTTSKGPLPK